MLLIASFCLCVGFLSAAEFPSTIKKCSLSDGKFNECITAQAKAFQPNFIKGIPEYGIEPMDPLALENLESKAGTFNLKSKNVIVKGMRNMEVKDLAFNWKKMTGSMRLFGNVTFISDYETEGRLLLLPLSGKGQLVVKIWDLDVRTTYKLKLIKDAKGVEHLMSYEQKPMSKFGYVKIKMNNVLGTGELDKPINQVINENWKELMVDLGPPYVQGIFNKVESFVNKFYSQIAFSDMVLP